MKTTPAETRESLLNLLEGKGLSILDVAKTLGISQDTAAFWHLELRPGLLQLDAPELALLHQCILALCKADLKLLGLTKDRLEYVLINPAFRTPDTTPDLFRFFLRLLYAIRDLARPVPPVVPAPPPPQPADPSAAIREMEYTRDVVDKFIILRAPGTGVHDVANILAIPLRAAQEWDSHFRAQIASYVHFVWPDVLRQQILASHQGAPGGLAAFHKSTESSFTNPISRVHMTPDVLRFQLQLLYRIQDINHSRQSSQPAPDSQNPQNLAA